MTRERRSTRNRNAVYKEISTDVDLSESPKRSKRRAVPQDESYQSNVHAKNDNSASRRTSKRSRMAPKDRTQSQIITELVHELRSEGVEADPFSKFSSMPSMSAELTTNVVQSLIALWRKEKECGDEAKKALGKEIHLAKSTDIKRQFKIRELEKRMEEIISEREYTIPSSYDRDLVFKCHEPFLPLLGKAMMLNSVPDFFLCGIASCLILQDPRLTVEQAFTRAQNLYLSKLPAKSQQMLRETAGEKWTTFVNQIPKDAPVRILLQPVEVGPNRNKVVTVLIQYEDVSYAHPIMTDGTAKSLFEEMKKAIGPFTDHRKVTFCTTPSDACCDADQGVVALWNRERSEKGLSPALHVVRLRGVGVISRSLYHELLKTVKKVFKAKIALTDKQLLNKETVASVFEDIRLGKPTNGKHVLVALHYLIFHGQEELFRDRTKFSALTAHAERRRSQLPQDPLMLSQHGILNAVRPDSVPGLHPLVPSKECVDLTVDAHLGIPRPKVAWKPRHDYALYSSSYFTIHGAVLVNAFQSTFPNEAAPNWMLALQHPDVRLLTHILGLSLYPLVQKYGHSLDTHPTPGPFMAKLMRTFSVDVRSVLEPWATEAHSLLCGIPPPVMSALGEAPSAAMLEVCLDLVRESGSNLPTCVGNVVNHNQKKRLVGWTKYPLTLLGLFQVKEEDGKMHVTSELDRSYQQRLLHDADLMEQLSPLEQEDLNNLVQRWNGDSMIRKVCDSLLDTPVVHYKSVVPLSQLTPLVEEANGKRKSVRSYASLITLGNGLPASWKAIHT